MGKILKGKENPFSIEYLIEHKGLTKEEATFKVRSRKKMCKEYWLSRRLY